MSGAPIRTRHGNKPTVLYRAFDRHGQLLYVGITIDAQKRLKQHGWRSAWWPLCARVEQQIFADRRSALDAERDLIETLRPPYNVTIAEHVRRTQESCRQARDANRKFAELEQGRVAS